jgi:hypothetical protein
MDNPVQAKRSSGLCCRLLPNCVAVQQKTLEHKIDWNLGTMNMLNCYAVLGRLGFRLHRAALRLHGVIHVKVLRTWES